MRKACKNHALTCSLCRKPRVIIWRLFTLPMIDPKPHPSRLLHRAAVVARWALAGLLAFWLLLAATAGVLHGFIVPRIGDLRPTLESLATRAIGIPVRIDRIEARSQGLIPSFELSGVRLLDAQQRPALHLPRVLLAACQGRPCPHRPPVLRERPALSAPVGSCGGPGRCQRPAAITGGAGPGKGRLLSPPAPPCEAVP